jgi:dTDP-glucose 4,6-dehydratase
VIRATCRLLDQLVPSSPHVPHERLISHVADRPGHDFRYAVDFATTSRELGWMPEHGIEEGLRRTVAWYARNRDWWEPIVAGSSDDEV